MKRVVLVWITIIALSVSASAITYLSAATFKQWLESGRPVIIVDIQTADGYLQHHIKGSIMTNAYPAGNEEELRRLDGVINMIMTSRDDVVIVRAAAKMGRISGHRAYNYMVSKGVPESRLYMLEGGISAWPYPELLE